VPELPYNFKRDAFAGLAQDYLRYRKSYPPQIIDGLLAAAALPPQARLLDLACGPGRVALAIADRFEEVWAVDQEGEMVDAGRCEAARRGIGNVRWQVGRAEALEAPAAGFDLVTIGEAFHRLDRPLVSRLALGWLKPGGSLATLGCESFASGKAPWRAVIRDVARAFVGEPAQRLGAPDVSFDQAIEDDENDLRIAGFSRVESHIFAVTRVWTLDELLGNLRSTSVLSRHALGKRHAAFERGLAQMLLAFDPSGRYAEDVRCGYALARTPPR
jgi:SAM-dependent methyltransferase